MTNEERATEMASLVEAIEDEMGLNRWVASSEGYYYRRSVAINGFVGAAGYEIENCTTEKLLTDYVFEKGELEEYMHDLYFSCKWPEQIASDVVVDNPPRVAE